MRKIKIFVYVFAFALLFTLSACDNPASESAPAPQSAPAATTQTELPRIQEEPVAADLDEDEDGEDYEEGAQDGDEDISIVIAVESHDDLLGEFSGFYQFTTIALGTYIDDAVNELGNPTSTFTMDLMGAETTTKSWWTLNFFRLSSSETVTFTNGYATSVMSTADASSNITAANFTQISSGMSELDVFEILGVPYSVTIIEFMGLSSTTVMWINANFSSGTVTFTNGAVTSTMNMNLN